MIRSTLLGLALASATFTASPSFATPPTQPQKNVTLEFRGPLKDALKQIAAQSGINLIVTGDLDRPSEVYLKDASGEEALDTVASAYQLKVTRKGSIWTLRPMNAAEMAAASEAEARGPGHVLPPLPPVPPVPPHMDAEDVDVDVDVDVDDLPDHVPGGATQDALQRLAEKGYPLHKAREGDAVSRGDLTIHEGQRVNTAVTYGGDLTVNGRVDGDAMAVGGDVTLGPKAVVRGNVITLGGELTKADGAKVRGDEVVIGGGSVSKVISSTVTRHHQSSRDDGDDEVESRSTSRGLKVSEFLMWFAVLFGVGFLFMIFSPARAKEIESALRKDPVRCGLAGLAGAVAFVPLLILLCITVVGIPVALALVFVTPLALAVGYGAVANEIGMRLPVFRGRKTQAMVLALGLLAILLVGMIPVLGVLVHVGVSFLAIGAIIRTRFGSRPKGFPEPIPPNTVPVG